MREFQKHNQNYFDLTFPRYSFAVLNDAFMNKN